MDIALLESAMVWAALGVGLGCLAYRLWSPGQDPRPQNPSFAAAEPAAGDP